MSEERIEVDRDWAVILAGGAGRRLLPLTREIAGDDRPKQYCALFGGATLLGDTRARLLRSIPPHHTLCIVNRAHDIYYRDELRDLSPVQLIEQPCDRGTASAIAYSTVRLSVLDPDAVVGFFPADHHYANPGHLRATVAAAYRAARQYPEFIFLVGAEAEYAETDYGWIDPGQPIAEIDRAWAFRVARFWEKPSAPIARVLLERRALWNTFVMVGHVDTFWTLLRRAASSVAEAFDSLRPAAASSAEAGRAVDLYATLPMWDFSRDVVTSVPASFGVIPLAHAGWTDLGRPERVTALADAGG